MSLYLRVTGDHVLLGLPIEEALRLLRHPSMPDGATIETSAGIVLATRTGYHPNIDRLLRKLEAENASKTSSLTAGDHPVASETSSPAEHDEEPGTNSDSVGASLGEELPRVERSHHGDGCLERRSDPCRRDGGERPATIPAPDESGIRLTFEAGKVVGDE